MRKHVCLGGFAFAVSEKRGIVKLHQVQAMSSDKTPKTEAEYAAQIGQQVRKVRKFFKMSQGEAAQLMAWSRLKWGQMERGGVKVSASELERLGWLFGVSPDYFLSIDKNPETSRRLAALRQVDIGKRVHKARLHLRLTQSEMARELGCSHAKWSRIEQGKAELSVSELLKLIHKLDISLDQFLSLAPDWLDRSGG